MNIANCFFYNAHITKKNRYTPWISGKKSEMSTGYKEKQISKCLLIKYIYLKRSFNVTTL